MTGMLISGKRSTLRRRSDTRPSTVIMSDSIRIRIGFLRARRVSHMRSPHRGPALAEALGPGVAAALGGATRTGAPSPSES